VDAAIRQYNSTNASFVIADPLLGWAPRPGVRTSLYTYNSQGLRVKTPEMVYSTAATPGRERIAVFGDSFANGAEVGNDQTWASYAEDALRQVGTNAEVLNFGVNGYGMDQAYLRWRHHGSAYAPSVVVFALQLENAKRNMNLIRPMYVRATENLPFSKPRFVIESGQLRLINSPVVPPEQLPDTIRHLRDWPLAPFEQYFRPADYSPSLWSASLALSFLGQTIGGDKPDDIASSDERELAIRIMEAFRDSVQSSGARFVILYLPKRHELRSVRNTGKAPDDAFLQQIEQRLGLVSAADALLAQSRKTSVDALYQEGGHYSPEGNQVVARFLTEALTSR
jgi:lysophospholipase L1-like esterase